MKLQPYEVELVRAALDSHIESIEAFLNDATEFDEVDSVRAELLAARGLRARLGPKVTPERTATRDKIRPAF